MEFSPELIMLGLAFLTIAAVYSSAGFGGGSSYLALLTFIPMDFKMMRFTALLCNIIVVIGSIFYVQFKDGISGKFLRRLVGLVVLSIPLAYLSGKFPIKETAFFTILGVVLIASSVAMWLSSSKQMIAGNMQPNRGYRDTFVSGGLGAMAGLVGIGGGIFLSPYLHLTKWDASKKIALATSVFILLNSLSGMAGQLRQNFDPDFSLLFILGGCVMGGSILGNIISAKKYSNRSLRRVTALIVFLAGINVLIRVTF